MLQSLLLDLASATRPERIPILQKFFQTQKGGYAEGDKFLGLYVPEMRKIAKKYEKFLDLDAVQKLLDSKIHEHRFVGLVLLVSYYKKARNPELKEEYFDFYLKNTKNINNRDLVDVSAPNVVGEFLRGKLKDKNSGFLPTQEGLKILNRLAESENLWERRIAMVSTLKFIKNGKIEKTIELCEKLLDDKHHLIHKACGWMLREAWKEQKEPVEDFLDEFAGKMPRTMLRYAIEMMEEEKRKGYLLLP